MKRVLLAGALIIAGLAPVSPVEASKPWLCPKYTAQIKQTFPRKHWRTMDRIIWRESKCERRAVGWNYHPGKTHRDCPDRGNFHARKKCSAVRSWDVGLFQINSTWHTLTKRVCGRTPRTKVLMTVRCQFRVAGVLYNDGGLAHWAGTSKTKR